MTAAVEQPVGIVRGAINGNAALGGGSMNGHDSLVARQSAVLAARLLNRRRLLGGSAGLAVAASVSRVSSARVRAASPLTQDERHAAALSSSVEARTLTAWTRFALARFCHPRRHNGPDYDTLTALDMDGSVVPTSRSHGRSRRRQRSNTFKPG